MPRKGHKRIPMVLKDMRAVYSQPEGRDRGEGQKTCRELLKESRKDFMAHLARLEQGHMARAAKVAAASTSSATPTPSSAGPSRPDAGEEKALDLLDRLLGEYAP